jgi:trigger factor
MQHVLPRSFTEAVKERNLDLVADPSFENIDYTMGSPLKFKAVFEVYPRLDVSNYKGIPAQEIAVSVEESEIETTLKKLQNDMAELTPVEEDRPVRESDFVEISFNGTIQGEIEEPITAEKAVVEIGGASKKSSQSLTIRIIPRSVWPGRPSNTRSRSKESRKRRFLN